MIVSVIHSIHQSLQTEAAPSLRSCGRSMARTACSLLAFLFLSGCNNEPERSYPMDRLTLEHTIDRETIQVGDPALLTLTAVYPTGGVLRIPELGREKEIVVLDRRVEDTLREDGLIRTDASFTLTSFRLGEHLLTTGTVEWVAQEHTDLIVFPPITLHVESALGSEASSAIEDIKATQKLPGRMPRWIWIALLVSVAAFLIGILSNRLWKKRSQPMPSAPPTPPHIKATEALEALRRSGLLDEATCEPFFTALSHILRTYLEERFMLNAPDRTTEEIIEDMSLSSELDGLQRGTLQEFMEQADLVKFARERAALPVMEKAFETAERFVEQTRKSEPEEEPNHSESPTL